jgi:Holliday junction resolvase RusA-like endonuclease
MTTEQHTKECDWYGSGAPCDCANKYREPGPFQVDVLGLPVPQGSKRAFRHARTGRVVMVDDNPSLTDWRATLAGQARKAMAGSDPFTRPVRASLGFYLPRPTGHYGTGRNAGTLRPSAPDWPGVKPDLDKLIRAVFDALTVAGVWRDDALCCGLSAWKAYADARPVGLALTVTELEGRDA